MPYKRVLHAIFILNPELRLKTQEKYFTKYSDFVKQESQMAGKKIKLILASVKKNQPWHKTGHKNVSFMTASVMV
jgi:hypothetical protein